MEKIVRPFDNLIGYAPRVFVDKREAEDHAIELVDVSWGGEIDSDYRPWSDNLLEFDVKNTWSEVDRSTTTVRVSNPDDSSQFVDVERTDRLRLRNVLSGKEQEWELSN